MEKLYIPKKKQSSKKLNPKKETVSFLLNYSKALKIISAGDMKIEVIIN